MHLYNIKFHDIINIKIMFNINLFSNGSCRNLLLLLDTNPWLFVQMFYKKPIFSNRVIFEQPLIIDNK